MYLSEGQKSLITNLRSQEQLCIDKYTHYASLAKDTELTNLFNTLKENEQQHYDSLSQVLSGTVPAVSNSSQSKTPYNPVATYTGNFNASDKEFDKFLCSDSIATEKYASSEYNNDLFQFGEENIRKLLNNIQTEEQNHAEMIYKYKTANKMN